ncbi:MAG: hypothetical protein U5K32_09060 [Bacteroidales bacterium]|nr:hypothetical protein [Bacteroidales bacterium]
MVIRIGNTRRRKPGNANPLTLGIIFAIVGGALFFLFALPPLQYSGTSKAWQTVQGIKPGDYMLAGIAAIFFFVGLFALSRDIKAKRQASEAKMSQL